MSYSKLILKQSPDIVWAFDDIDESSSISYPINFFNTAASVYSASINASSTNLLNIPIVFGGNTALSLTSSSTPGISIPAMGRFSEIYSSRNYALEFWMRCDKVPSVEIPIVKKRNFSNIGLFLKNNYLMYRYGTSSSYIEAVYGLAELDEPTHIIMNFSNNSIQLIVNGVISQPESEGVIKLQIDNNHSINDYLDFYGSPDFNIIIDSIAIYPFKVSSNEAKTHYIYGLGKNIDPSIFYTNGGDFYNLSSNNTEKASYEYWDFPDEWKLIRYDNVLHNNFGITNFKFDDPILITQDSKITTSSNTIRFSSSAGSTNGSCIDIENISSIMNNSNFVFTKIKFDGTLPPSGSSQTIISFGQQPLNDLFKFRLKNTSGSYYVQILDIASSSAINFYIPSITSSPTAYLGMSYQNRALFYFALSGSAIQTGSFTTSSSGFSEDLFDNYFPLTEDSILRIGSNYTYDQTSSVSTNIDQFNGTFLKFVSIKNNFSGSSYSDIDTYLEPIYEASYNSSKNRFSISSFGNANFIIHGKRLSTTASTGSAVLSSNRFEFGYPDVVSGSEVSIYATMYNYSGSVIQTKTQLSKVNFLDWLNLRDISDKYIIFDIDIYGKDVNYYRPFVKYLKYEAYSQTTGSYTTITYGGAEDIIIRNGASAQSYIPEFYETPTVFITNTSGIKSNRNYIDFSFSSSIIGTIGFFIKFNESASSALKFINALSGSISIFSASTNSSNTISLFPSSSVRFFVNGASANSASGTEWMHMTFTFVPKITTTSSIDTFTIRFGDLNKSNFNIQNIYFTDIIFTSDEVSYIHNAFIGGPPAIKSGSTASAIFSLIDKNEPNHTSSITYRIFQPFTNETRLAYDVKCATNASLSTYLTTPIDPTYNYFDDIKIENSDYVLSIEDDKLYQYIASVQKYIEVPVNTNNYINILSGQSYEDYNFMKYSGSFVLVPTLEKMKIFVDSN